MKNIILGGGCFWCIEAALKELEGVEKAVSGYAGGHKEDPSYEEVCKGDTGHAEVVKITYDSEKLTLEKLLRKFFKIHNPTTENRQGPDQGSQYRSIILYNDIEQKKTIDKLIDELGTSYKEPIVTEIRELDKFYKAEEKHQDYFAKNPESRYCKVQIPPKIEKVKD